MKSSNSKRNDLIEAILSRDKDKLKKILQEGKPEKWICIEMDYESRVITADKKTVNEEEVIEMLKENEKDYCVKLIVMEINKQEDGSRVENWTFLNNPEFQLDFKKVTLKL